MDPIAMLWRRLDTPGHDACVLARTGHGWTLRGAAVFREERGEPAQLAYAVSCDEAWRTQSGQVTGFIGSRQLDVAIARLPTGAWSCNGAIVTGLDDLADLDFHFTPATNLPQIMRAAIADGASVEVPVVWLGPGEATLTRLPQRYERRDASRLWYESPSTNYQALLELNASGFVSHYPGLWVAEGVTDEGARPG